MGKIGRLIARVFNTIKGALGKLLRSQPVRDMLNSALGKIVTQVVTELQTTDLSSSEKREEALRRIADSAQQAGIGFKTSFVSLLIELAVARIKGYHIG